MNKDNTGNTGNQDGKEQKDSKQPKNQLQKRGFNLLNAPGAIGSFVWTWLGVCLKHFWRPDAQLWYKITSPFLVLMFVGSVINLTDLMFFDIFWGATTFFVLNSGLYADEKEYLSNEWDETVKCITGKEETIEEGLEKTTVRLKKDVIEAEFTVEEIPPEPPQSKPEVQSKNTRNLYQDLAEEFGEDFTPDSDFTG